MPPSNIMEFIPVYLEGNRRIYGSTIECWIYFVCHPKKKIGGIVNHTMENGKPNKSQFQGSYYCDFSFGFEVGFGVFWICCRF